MRIVLLLLVLPLIICWNVRSTHANPRIRDVAVIPANTQCLNDREISNAIRKLAAGNAADVDKIHAELITKSSLSVNCRGKIVTGLMKAMDKPKLDFDRDTSMYYLWLYGATLLADLRASEALDLLIAHLNVANHYFSSSMTHQPAMLGVIRMGPIAIPKLGEVLQHHPDLKMRYSAVYCLASIGGEEAVTELKAALGSESDKCCRRLISVSLDSFDKNGNIRNRLEWFARFTCRQ